MAKRMMPYGFVSKFATVFTVGVLLGAAPNAEAQCPADLDGNGIVGASDLGLLLLAWGTPGGPADLNGDGIVGAADLGLLLLAWGPCPVVLPILEPPPMHMPPAAPIDSSEMPSWADNPYGKMGINGMESRVYNFSGESVVHAVDLRVRGRGMDFVLARKYRSRQQTLSPLSASNQWDFSYNVWVEQSGPDLVLHDGNTRSDLYLFDPGTGTWSADGTTATQTMDRAIPSTGECCSSN